MKRLFAATALAAIVTAGCSSSVDNPDDVRPTDPTTGNLAPPSTGTLSPNRVLFSPNQGILPYPHDAYFTPTPGVATDGTLNLPSSAFFPATLRLPGTNPVVTEPVVNALDGFSTQAPIKLRFSTAINLATSAAGIRLIEVHVDPATKATIGTTAAPNPVRRVLVQDVDYRVETAPNIDAAGTLVQLVPLRPLLANNDAPGAGRPRDIGYLVLVTNALRAANGAPIDADTDYATIKTAALSNAPAGNCASITDARLNGLCNLARAHFGAAGVAGVSPATIVVSASFTTQSVDTVLRAITATVAASPPPATLVLPVPAATTGQISPTGPNLADLHFATITLPYYLSTPVAPPAGTGTEPLSNFWRAANPPPAAAGLADPKNERNLTRFNPFPEVTTQLTVPMLLGIPRTPAVKPPEGWPVVIYQHGITEDRGTLALIADAAAAAGFVIVGIDLPLHGIMPNDPLYLLSPTNPAHAATLPAPFQAGEPTFNVDYVNNTTTAPGPDGLPDPSGQHFINLASLLTARDNVRQGAANLIALTRAVPTLDLDGNPATVDIDAARMHFFGWSLGGIIGSAYMGTPLAVANIKSVSLFAAGCGILETLRNSPGYAPVLNNGLAAAGIVTNSSLYFEFVHAAQAVVESGDGCNYAANWAAKPTLMQMIQGTTGDATKPTDRAVPNSSTLRLAELLGLPTITATLTNPAGAHGLTRFTEGGHGTIALPASGTAQNPGPETLPSYLEARNELRWFLELDGTEIRIANPAILAPQ
jgi:hypothetical protein